MAVYRLTVTTLSPLHIGDGDELRKEFDFAVHDNRTYRLDVDALLEARGSRLAPNRQGNYPPPAKLLEDADYSDLHSPFFRYVLPGIPRSGKDYTSLRSHIKDSNDYPYIPGSSLKGALRTALGWTGWKDINLALDRSMVGRGKYPAAQALERKIFGRDPNHDLLRALQVSDCAGIPKPGARLRVVNAQVLTARASSSPVELEAIRGDSTFSGTLHIDEYLFTPQAEGELGFSSRRRWLDELLPRVQQHSQARLQTLVSWFEQAEGTAEIAQFYRKLEKFELAPNQALLQLGWGVGWDGTTFSTRLQENQALFEQIISDFQLNRAGRDAPPRRAGDPFPHSKRVAMRIDKAGQPGVAAAPMGWVLLETERIK